jgi:hypothetical protein
MAGSCRAKKGTTATATAIRGDNVAGINADIKCNDANALDGTTAANAADGVNAANTTGGSSKGKSKKKTTNEDNTAGLHTIVRRDEANAMDGTTAPKKGTTTTAIATCGDNVVDINADVDPNKANTINGAAAANTTNEDDVVGIDAVVKCNDTNDMDDAAAANAADGVDAANNTGESSKRKPSKKTTGGNNMAGIDAVVGRKDANAMDGTAAPNSAKGAVNVVEKVINADNNDEDPPTPLTMTTTMPT